MKLSNYIVGAAALFYGSQAQSVCKQNDVNDINGKVCSVDFKPTTNATDILTLATGPFYVSSEGPLQELCQTVASGSSNVRVIVKDTSEKRTLSQWCPVDVTTIAELAQYLPKQIGDIDTTQVLNLITDVAQSRDPKFAYDVLLLLVPFLDDVRVLTNADWLPGKGNETLTLVNKASQLCHEGGAFILTNIMSPYCIYKDSFRKVAQSVSVQLLNGIFNDIKSGKHPSQACVLNQVYTVSGDLAGLLSAVPTIYPVILNPGFVHTNRDKIEHYVNYPHFSDGKRQEMNRQLQDLFPHKEIVRLKYIVDNIIGKELNIDKENVEYSTSMKNTPQWDSIAMSNIISKLEEVLDIKIALQDAEEMIDLESILDILESRYGFIHLKSKESLNSQDGIDFLWAVFGENYDFYKTFLDDLDIEMNMRRNQNNDDKWLNGIYQFIESFWTNQNNDDKWLNAIHQFSNMLKDYPGLKDLTGKALRDRIDQLKLEYDQKLGNKNGGFLIWELAYLRNQIVSKVLTSPFLEVNSDFSYKLINKAAFGKIYGILNNFMRAIDERNPRFPLNEKDLIDIFQNPQDNKFSEPVIFSSTNGVLRLQFAKFIIEVFKQNYQYHA